MSLPPIRLPDSVLGGFGSNQATWQSLIIALDAFLHPTSHRHACKHVFTIYLPPTPPPPPQLPLRCQIVNPSPLPLNRHQCHHPPPSSASCQPPILLLLLHLLLLLLLLILLYLFLLPPPLSQTNNAKLAQLPSTQLMLNLRLNIHFAGSVVDR